MCLNSFSGKQQILDWKVISTGGPLTLSAGRGAKLKDFGLSCFPFPGILRPAFTLIRFGSFNGFLLALLPSKHCFPHFPFNFTVLSFDIQERIFNLYDTDQEDLPVTSPVLMRLRKSGVEANVRPDKRTTLFVADWICIWMTFLEGQERPFAHSAENWHALSTK